MKKQLYLLILLTILFSLSTTTTLAGKDTLTLILIDGYTNKPISNKAVKIELLSKRGTKKAVYELESDDLGKIRFVYINAKELMLNAKLKSADFLEIYSVIDEDEMKEGTVTFPFYPSRSYEKEMLKLEDKKYGRVKHQSIVDKEEADTLLEDNVEEEPYTPAEYPGGPKALQQFIAKTVSYPQISIEMNEQGKVFCGFVVESDGFISHVEVIKSVSKELDQEAKRLVRAMQNWTPGADSDGIVGRTKCYIPINFTLN